MRALFSCYPGQGHLQPMIPIAAAMRDRGHDVLFAAAPSFHPTIRAFGFDAASGGADDDVVQAEFARRVPDMDAIPYGSRRVIAFTRLFAEIAAPLAAPSMLELASRWHPDVVVHDVAEYAGALVASSMGCPSVTHSYGRMLPSSIAEAAGRLVGPLWERYGLDPVQHGGLYGAAYLDICPPSLQVPEIADAPTLVAPLRPQSLGGVSEPLADWRRNEGWPSVYVTLGTRRNRPEVFDAVLAGLAGQSLNVLVTVGRDNDPAAFVGLPSNVCILKYVPQACVLPTVDAVICHAGSGTMLGGLAHGLPLVLLPMGADQFYNAEACKAAGVCEVLAPDQVTPGAISSAVHAVLTERRYGDASRLIQDEIAAMPSASDRVDLVENLVSSTATGPHNSLTAAAANLTRRRGARAAESDSLLMS